MDLTKGIKPEFLELAKALSIPEKKQYVIEAAAGDLMVSVTQEFDSNLTREQIISQITMMPYIIDKDSTLVLFPSAFKLMNVYEYFPEPELVKE